jgi:hypothetical protein
MSGYTRIYAVGGQGGFLGADGINPIECLILVGDGNRRWLEPHYFNSSIAPLGKIRQLVPPGPDHEDALLDACIAFCPAYFAACPSMKEVEVTLRDADGLDFDPGAQQIPTAWARLREEARAVFAAMNIWQADLSPLERR